MLSVLWGFLRANWLSVLKWLAIAISVGFVLIGARRQGRLVERTEYLESLLEKERQAKRVEEEVRRLPEGGALKELRSRWQRD